MRPVTNFLKSTLQQVAFFAGGIGCLLFVVWMVFGYFFWVVGARPLETSGEISVATARGSLSGLPITIERAYRASSHGGLHGDGSSITIAKYPVLQSEALIASLKQANSSHTWTETRTGYSSLRNMRRLISKDFLPADDSVKLIAGQPPRGGPYIEYLVDPSSGLIYAIHHTL